MKGWILSLLLHVLLIPKSPTSFLIKSFESSLYLCGNTSSNASFPQIEIIWDHCEILATITA